MLVANHRVALAAFFLCAALTACSEKKPTAETGTEESALCGSLTCAPGGTCVTESCVRDSCVGIVCDPGSACADGVCVSTRCTSNECGAGQVCIGNQCVYADCVGVACVAGSVCVRGACLPASCEGQTCPSGFACFDNRCVEPLCAGVTCAAPKVCAAGVCVDPGTLSNALTITSPASGLLLNTETSADPVSFAGKCAGVSSVRLVIDGTALTTSTPCTSSGDWSTTTSAASWSEGDHNILVEGETTGEENARSAAITITKDTVAPSVTGSGAATANATTALAYDVTGTCSETGRGVDVLVDGTPVGTLSCTGPGFSGAVNISGVSNGSHTLAFRHTDAAGNRTTTATASVAVDQGPPSISLTPDDGVAKRTKTWSWTCPKTGCVTRYVVNTSPTYSFTGAEPTGTTATQPSGDGTYYLHIRGTDPVGNFTDVSDDALLDNTAPTADAVTLDEPTSPGSDTTPTLKVTGVDPTVVCTVHPAADCSGATLATQTSSGSDVYLTTSALTQGTRPLYVALTDVAGNRACVGGVTYVLDTTPAGAFTINSPATVGNGQITITWTASAGATSYIVRYGTSAGVYGSTWDNSATPTAQTATVTGLSNGQIYYFMVTAVKTGGNRDATAAVSATPIAPPATPTWTSAEGKTRSIDLVWPAVTGAASYTVVSDTNAGGAFATTSCSTTTATSCTVGTLADGTRYYFKLRATNAGGTSAFSTVIDAWTLPAAPTGVNAARLGDGVRVSWTGVTSATSYTVKRGPTGGPWPTTVACTESDPLAVICTEENLTPGLQYFYVVVANNASGAGATSTQATVSVGALEFAAGAPSASTASGANIGAVTVNLVDSDGVPVTDATDSITVALTTPAGATLSGTTTQAMTSGVASFNDLSVDKVGTYTLTATSAKGFAAATSVSFNITAGSASALKYSFGETVSIPQAECSGPYTVEVVDSGGNSVANSSGSDWTLPVSTTGTLAVFQGSDTACSGSTLANLTVTNGASTSASFRLLNNTDGTANLVVDGTSISTGTLTKPVVTTPVSGRFAFVGSNNAIRAYTINTATGALSFTTSLSVSYRGFDVIPGKYAYVSVGNTVAMYSVNSATGTMTALAPATIAAGTTASAVAVHPTGKWVYVVNQGSDNVSMYSVNAATGQLTALTPATIAAGDTPQDMVIDKTGAFAYVSNLYTANISVYSINPTTGELSNIATTNSPSVYQWPDRLSLSPNGKFLYVTNGYSGDMSIYTRDVATGFLTHNSDFYPGNSVYAVGVEAQSKFAYVGIYNAFNIYSINQTTGVLTNIGSSAVGNYPWSVEVEPAGNFVYVLSQGAHNISGFSINKSTGALTSIGAAVAGGTSPWRMVITP